ncbi:6-bladed beta-propeller [bacterium]|nr:6-bladed beta-propeller [bacterium]
MPLRDRTPLLSVLFLAAALTLAAPAAHAEWQGSTATADGATVVTNPESPAYGSARQEMRQLWRRGGDEDEIFFGTIAEFLHDDAGNIYLLDGQLSEIHVFDPAGELVDTIGRQGEGPGEFQNGADMFWAPNGEIGVVQAWPGKIVMLTPQGDPGTTFKLPFRDGGGWQSVTRGARHGDNVLLSGTAWTREGETNLQFTYLKSYDMAGNETAGFAENRAEVSFGNYQFDEKTYTDFQRRWAVAPDGRVAAALDFDAYRIHVWNADGSLDRIIERPGFAPVARTGEEKARFQAMYESFTRWNRGSTFKVSDTHQTVNQIFFRNDGTLWVQNAGGRYRAPDGVFTSFDVYDQVGRFVQTVTLVADADAVEDGLFFAGDRAYVVTDLFNALMARFGGGEEDAAATEAEPVTVVAFEFAPVVAAGR